LDTLLAVKTPHNNRTKQYPHFPSKMLIATLWVAISIPQGKGATPSNKAQYAKSLSSLGSILLPLVVAQASMCKVV